MRGRRVNDQIANGICKAGLHVWVEGQRQCKPCKKMRNALDGKKPERKVTMRSWQLKQYGLTIEEYEEMLSAQGGVCAICGKLPDKYRLAVDHNHETGKVRGLLCIPCNRGVGIFQDSSELLINASDYLKGDKFNDRST